MKTSHYRSSRNAFATAIRLLNTRPTVHEGLYAACIESLQWIDAEVDLPTDQRAAFVVWRDGLLPAQGPMDTPRHLLTTLQRLDSHQASDKAARLIILAERVSRSNQ